MHTKRIIPCLDVNNGRVVKGVNFVDLKDAGDPVEIGKAYDKAGADELVFFGYHGNIRCKGNGRGHGTQSSGDGVYTIYCRRGNPYG